MQIPYMKPKRGQSPDGLPVQERDRLDQQLSELRTREGAALADLNDKKELLKATSFVALTEPTMENIKAKNDAEIAVSAAVSALNGIRDAIAFAVEKRKALAAEINNTTHKRKIDAVERHLNSSVQGSEEVTASAKQLIAALSKYRATREAASAAKPQWPNDFDGMGLDHRTDEIKLSHELWRIAAEAGVEWPSARNEGFDENYRAMPTLAERLRQEIPSIMDRLRNRVVLHDDRMATHAMHNVLDARPDPDDHLLSVPSVTVDASVVQASIPPKKLSA